jgi:hypothetical protein
MPDVESYSEPRKSSVSNLVQAKGDSMNRAYKNGLYKLVAGIILLSSMAPAPTSTGQEQKAVQLKQAKLIIEHNATDEDTGFQGFLDGEGWRQIEVIGPEGAVLRFEGCGKVGSLGLTELFFETVEPENSRVPINAMLARLPAGEYVFKGIRMENGVSQGTTVGRACLTHTIPEGPVLISPKKDETVQTDALTVSWHPVTTSLDGKPLEIIAFQLIIEKDEAPHPNMIGKRCLSMYLPASVTNITIPKGFLEPGTAYKWEVLAIEESGNQTLSSSQFKTN